MKFLGEQIEQVKKERIVPTFDKWVILEIEKEKETAIWFFFFSFFVLQPSDCVLNGLIRLIGELNTLEA